MSVSLSRQSTTNAKDSVMRRTICFAVVISALLVLILTSPAAHSLDGPNGKDSHGPSDGLTLEFYPLGELTAPPEPFPYDARLPTSGDATQNGFGSWQDNGRNDRIRSVDETLLIHQTESNHKAIRVSSGNMIGRHFSLHTKCAVPFSIPGSGTNRQSVRHHATATATRQPRLPRSKAEPRKCKTHTEFCTVSAASWG